MLAARLLRYAGRHDVRILALPRGGVPVACEVATRLEAPLDVLVVRKLGVPGHAELAMGALATGGVQVLDQELIDELGVPDEAVARVVATQKQELRRREEVYRGGARPLDVAGRIVLLVDDGLATGATMRAAARAVRALGPSRVVVAVPVASGRACSEIAREVEEVVCPFTPDPFEAVGLWYDTFDQVTDAEVRRLVSGDPPGARAAQPPS